MTFTGIIVTVGGDGGGGEIIALNVTIAKSTTGGSGVSLALLGRVNGFHAYFNECQVIEGLKNNHRKNSTEESCKTYEHPSGNTESDVSTAYHSTSINIEARENSMENCIHIDCVLVKEHTPVSGIFCLLKLQTNQRRM